MHVAQVVIRDGSAQISRAIDECLTHVGPDGAVLHKPFQRECLLHMEGRILKNVPSLTKKQTALFYAAAESASRQECELFLSALRRAEWALCVRVH